MNYTNTASLDAARNYIQQGAHQQAWYILDQMLKYSPPDAEAYFLLSLISEDPDECVHLLNNALSIDPRHTAARRRLNELKPQASAPQWKASAPSPRTPTPGTPMPPVPPLINTHPAAKSVPAAESPVMVALPEGLQITSKGISYQFSGSRRIPFMGKADEYGFAPIQHINAVEVKRRRVIPRGVLLVVGLLVMAYYFGSYFYAVTLLHLAQNSILSAADLVPPACLLAAFFFVSFLHTRQITIRSAGSVFVSMRLSSSESQIKQFLDAYLQLSASKS